MAQFPAVYAGTKLDAALLQSLVPQTVRKTIDEQIVNNATLQNDDQLFLSVVANAVYQVELCLFVSSSSTTNFKCGFTVPSGAAGAWGGHSIVTGLSGTSGDLSAAKRDFTQSASLGAGTNPLLIIVEGLLTTSATAGTLTFQWCQDTASGSFVTIVYAGSWMRLTRTL